MAEGSTDEYTALTSMMQLVAKQQKQLIEGIDRIYHEIVGLREYLDEPIVFPTGPEGEQGES